MNFTSFLVYCFIVTFTPGPTNIVILSTVHNLGTKKAIEYALGATTAFGVLLSISAILNNLLMTVLPRVLIFMQVIGCIYILYLAYHIYIVDTSKSSATESATFKSGFFMQFINPKVVLFTMTVLPSFVMPYYKTPKVIAIYVVLVTIIGFLAFFTWLLCGTLFKDFLQKYQKPVNIIMCLFLVYSAIAVSGILGILKG